MTQIRDEKRAEGARLIVSVAHDIAEASGTQLTRVFFDLGSELVEQNIHLLTLGEGGRTVFVEFSDKDLVEFYDWLGRAAARAKVRNGVNQLLDKTGHRTEPVNVL
jgi:transglutaminase-like putative cysteine protease